MSTLRISRIENIQTLFMAAAVLIATMFVTIIRNNCKLLLAPSSSPRLADAVQQRVASKQFSGCRQKKLSGEIKI
jgi:hypothetical protein